MGQRDSRSRRNAEGARSARRQEAQRNSPAASARQAGCGFAGAIAGSGGGFAGEDLGHLKKISAWRRDDWHRQTLAPNAKLVHVKCWQACGQPSHIAAK
ncbi:hypothetical protein BN2475_530037 [Paraburkholderia ribeironis]|uniref:Uncharacterized protein n=1 Tax=Paraburkholderia ribeironis TaxID=1247936 RepID=A0A1N7SCQ0_9BURK|nr:hypothetical protein BN2475_530037 [Paraburkholderia ribeironis]